MKKLVTLLLLMAIWQICFAQTAESVRLAYSYYNSQEYDKAAYEFENLFNQTKSKNYFNYYINCLVNTNQFDKAEKIVKKQISANKSDKSYNIVLGYVYKKAGQEAKATSVFEDVVENVEIQPNVIKTLSGQFSSFGEYSYAEKILLKGQEKTSADFDRELMSVYSAMRNNAKMIEKGLDIVGKDPRQHEMIENSFQYNLNSDVNNEFYNLLRTSLLTRINKSPSIVFSEMLIWLFVQKKNFRSALVQAKAIDKRANENGQRLINIGDMALECADYQSASDAYQYVVNKGQNTIFLQKAQFGLLTSLYKQVEEGLVTDQTVIDNLQKQYAAVFEQYGITNTTIGELINYSKLQTYYLNKPDNAATVLENALTISTLNQKQIAQIRLQLGDIQLFKEDIWGAIMTYAKVENDNKQNEFGDQAKFCKAKMAYYTGNFKWALSQLDILKTSTSKFIANDAMALSLLINDNCERQMPSENDTTSSISEEPTSNVALRIYARADMQTAQKKYDVALQTLDTIILQYNTHSLVDEAFYKKAQIYLEQKNNSKAAQCLDSIVTNYSYDVLADKAAFKLAKICANDNVDKAKKLCLNILSDYPGSIYAVEARELYRKLSGE